jgi:MoaA/NifB/PqqE/SkfB family radical SAM enzyme
VLWLGQTCNLRCFFCYFIDKINDKEHPENKFMPLEKAKEICLKLRTVYGNTSIDIQGGEPTIYSGIYDLISYCRSIGLKPTLITNAIAMADEDKCRKYKDARIEDFLISLHALGDVFDKIVGLKGGSERQLKALRNLQKLGIPFRINTTMTKPSLGQLMDISTIAAETGARSVNFITFNPFADQQGAKRSKEGVPRYSEISEHLTKAVDMLEKSGTEVNIRYLPLCMMPESYRKNIYNFQQLSYDQHEWDFNSWTWTTRFNQRSASDEIDETIPILLYNIHEYNGISFGNTAVHGTKEHYMREIDVREHLLKLFSADVPKDMIYRQNAKLRAEKHCKYHYSEACSMCDVKDICDGFHSDYAEMFGTDEADPVKLGFKTDDPKYYINNQKKADI